MASANINCLLAEIEENLKVQQVCSTFTLRIPTLDLVLASKITLNTTMDCNMAFKLTRGSYCEY